MPHHIRQAAAAAATVLAATVLTPSVPNAYAANPGPGWTLEIANDCFTDYPPGGPHTVVADGSLPGSPIAAASGACGPHSTYNLYQDGQGWLCAQMTYNGLFVGVGSGDQLWPAAHECGTPEMFWIYCYGDGTQGWAMFAGGDVMVANQYPHTMTVGTVSGRMRGTTRDGFCQSVVAGPARPATKPDGGAWNLVTSVNPETVRSIP